MEGKPERVKHYEKTPNKFNMMLQVGIFPYSVYAYSTSSYYSRCIVNLSSLLQDNRRLCGSRTDVCCGSWCITHVHARFLHNGDSCRWVWYAEVLYSRPTWM